MEAPFDGLLTQTKLLEAIPFAATHTNIASMAVPTGFSCYRPPSLHPDESRTTKEAWFEQLPTFTTAKRIASANELCKGHILGNLA